MFAQYGKGGAIILMAAAMVMLGTASANARQILPFAGVCGLNGPMDAEVRNVSASDILHVADTGNHRVILLSDGFDCNAFVIGQQGSQAGEFNAPQGVAVDANGFIYVADTGNHRIQKFENLDGLNPGDPVAFLQVFSSAGASLDAPRGLGTSDQNLIFVADTGNRRVVVFDTDGQFVNTLGGPDDGDNDTNGEFIEPADVAVCPSTVPDNLGGRIYVVDRGRHNVQVFDSNRNFLFSFSVQGSGLGQLSSPAGIAVDTQCSVYVADTGNHRIQMFDAEGGFLEVIGSGPSPVGVSVSIFQGQGRAGGGVYVTTSGNDDVSRFEFISYDTDNDGLIDSDGDGIPDLWEDEGIDLGFDGTVDLDLPALGAIRRHKDLFVEIDYMTFHEPDPDARDDVKTAFANAPVDNPDSIPGITLHIEQDEEIAYQNNINTWGDFDAIKANRFGTAAQRSSANAGNILAAKQLVYRYALYAHGIDDGNRSGRAKGGGNFVVSLGAGPPWEMNSAGTHHVGSRKQQAGTFMHELGHTLSLNHGGADGANYKPNYLSVMNYWFQTPWITNLTFPFGFAAPGKPDGRLDYSGQQLPALDETQLDEPAGIGLAGVENPDDFTAWWDPSRDDRAGKASGALDWDWSAGGIGSDAAVLADINGDRICVSPGKDKVLDTAPSGDDVVVGDKIWDGANRICDSPRVKDDIQGSTAQARVVGVSQPNPLVGHDDWQFLNTTPKTFSFRDDPAFAEGGQPFEDEQPELTAEEAHEIEAFWKSLFEKKFTYAAKFVCVSEVGPEGDAVSPGRYRTVINVHNPHADEVAFLKKAVIARPEGEAHGKISKLVEDRLEADGALSINCKTIAERFGGPSPIGDGFVVIKSDRTLDVVAVYTSRDSIDVEPIEPTVRKDEEKPPNGDKLDDGDDRRRGRRDLMPEEVKQTDAGVSINGPFCAFKAGTQNQVLIVKVANVGRADASATVSRVIFLHRPDGQQKTLATVVNIQDMATPALVGGEAILLEVPVPPDWPRDQNDPLAIIVDHEDSVSEANENNNKANGACFLPG
jgi:NHL repeat/CARDB